METSLADRKKTASASEWGGGVRKEKRRTPVKKKEFLPRKKHTKKKKPSKTPNPTKNHHLRGREGIPSPKTCHQEGRVGRGDVTGDGCKKLKKRGNHGTELWGGGRRGGKNNPPGSLCEKPTIRKKPDGDS